MILYVAIPDEKMDVLSFFTSVFYSKKGRPLKGEISLGERLPNRKWCETA